MERALLEIVDDASRRLRALDGREDSSDYDETALWVAIELHAKIIRVHPFQDGNGRTTRLVMGVVLVRLGLHPIPIEACKQEYTDALNAFFRSDARAPLFDLFLRLYID